MPCVWASPCHIATVNASRLHRMTLGISETGDTPFVEVHLNDQPSIQAPQTGTGSLSSYRRNASRWHSHVALHTTGSHPLQRLQRYRSTSNLEPTTSSQMSVASEDAVPQDSPGMRRVEGRYRRRNRKPSDMSHTGTAATHEKRSTPMEPSLSPGMTITVEDDNGELCVMRSPEVPTAPTFVGNRSPDTQSRHSSVGSLPIPHSPDESFTEAETSAASTCDTPTTRKNRTRMPHLPPKSAEEEARHLEAFTTMMREAKLVEKRKEEEHKAMQEKRLEQRMQTRQLWDQEILPCWTRARTEQQYRELWWDGVPGVLRSRLWPRACGNALMLPHNLFSRANDLVKQMTATEIFPKTVNDAIESDIERVLPSLKLFQRETGVMNQDLADVLYAFTAIRFDESSQRSRTGIEHAAELAEQYCIYIPGTASLAAVLLMNMSPQVALAALFNLIAARGWLHAYFSLESNSEVSHQLLAYERVFNTLIAEKLPVVYANIQKMGVRMGAYLREWITTLFVPWLDIDTVMRLWDIMCVFFSDQPP